METDTFGGPMSPSNTSIKSEQKIILFGGCDGCGKTTIAKELARVLGIPYFKPTGQARTARDNHYAFEMQTVWAEPKLLDFLKQTGHSAVIDRGFPCDWAYSLALGRERSTEWLDAIHELDRGYAELGALLVFTLKKDYSLARPDSDKRIDRKMLETLDLNYRSYYETSQCAGLLLETDDEDLMSQVTTILGELE